MAEAKADQLVCINKAYNLLTNSWYIQLTFDWPVVMNFT